MKDEDYNGLMLNIILDGFNNFYENENGNKRLFFYNFYYNYNIDYI
jgi:hypothetical protein